MYRRKNMAKEDTKIPGNMDVNERDNVPASATPVLIGTNPAKSTAIAVDKNSQTAKVEVTTDAKNPDGTKLQTGGLSASTIIWNEVSASGSTNYFAGPQTLISGVRITGNTGTSAIQYSVTQKGNTGG